MGKFAKVLEQPHAALTDGRFCPYSNRVKNFSYWTALKKHDKNLQADLEAISETSSAKPKLAKKVTPKLAKIREKELPNVTDSKDYLALLGLTTIIAGSLYWYYRRNKKKETSNL